MRQIEGNIIGGHTLEIYSTMEYAAMQQFGGSKTEFPNLWGDIPARPFFGIANEDEDAILKIIRDHLDAAIRP
jgi:phage gpG-like protein